jgi:UDP-glucose 6-dehydrogenase
MLKIGIIGNGYVGKSTALLNSNEFGYGRTCFPKDIKSLSNEMKKEKINPIILNASINRNENIDRKEKDWLENKNRSVI